MKRETPRKKIRRKILTETKQILLVLDSERAEHLYCSVCGEKTEMISPLAAARLFGVSTREIYRSIESGDLHYLEFEDRRIFVCLKSLRRSRLDFSLLSPSVNSG